MNVGTCPQRDPQQPDRRRFGIAGWVLAIVLAACGDDPKASDAADTGDMIDAAIDTFTDVAHTPDSATEPEPGVDTSAAPSIERIPVQTEPCRNPRYWPYSLHVPASDLRIHFRRPEDEAVAREVATAATWSLQVQLTRAGFRRAASDDGRCGPDGALDIFLWEDAPLTYTDLVASNETTPWEDGYPFIVLDAFATFGGAALPSTVAHEINHALQAADAWFDSPIAYEMTAMFVENLVYPDDDNWLILIEDYQASPTLSVDHDDGYETLYMYGSLLYLQYLSARFFPTDPSFIGAIWLAMRSPDDDNEPDFLDAIDAVLEPFGRSFADSVAEFAVWRWYTNYRDVGLHLPEAGLHPSRSLVDAREPYFGDGMWMSSIRNMLFGTEYIRIDPEGTGFLNVGLASSAPVQWVVQALTDEASDDDGRVMRLEDRVFRVRTDGKPVVLVVTALPGPTVDADPDTRPATEFIGNVQIRTANTGPR